MPKFWHCSSISLCEKSFFHFPDDNFQLRLGDHTSKCTRKKQLSDERNIFVWEWLWRIYSVVLHLQRKTCRQTYITSVSCLLRLFPHANTALLKKKFAKIFLSDASLFGKMLNEHLIYLHDLFPSCVGQKWLQNCFLIEVFLAQIPEGKRLNVWSLCMYISRMRQKSMRFRSI